MTAYDDTAAAREAAGVRLMTDAYARWAGMGPVTVGLDRGHSWTVLLALQAVMNHPAFAGGSGMGAAVEAFGRQLQEGVCDDAEVYAVAELGWARPEPGAPDAAGNSAESDPATVRLMMDAYTRWQTMPPVSATAGRQDTWTVMMALQLAITYPGIEETVMGPVVESVGRQLQAGLCDDPELYALAEAGWVRAADVEDGGAG
ncbi:hypothetical protein ABTY59_33760 [Streptomyces sp. NPDC096079]|uniref:hypothetical protein n=1 Tax=Streptomyces sp. NPDC096079 TaxID=3155820 RepID=UPI003322860D